MTDTIKKSLRESSVARWVVLLLLSSMMFFAYMFVDVLAPLKDLLEAKRGWSSEHFGTVGGSEFFLNVFAFFLIFAGIILDKIGVRRTAILAATLMVIGASIKLYGISDMFNNGGFGYDFLNSFAKDFPASAKMACIGFAIFGCGVEMAGITVSKAIVKWFKGRELALAMGLEMAIARLGVFAVFRLSPYLADGQFVSRPVAVGTLLLLIGFLSFSIYFLIDKKLDKQENIKLAPEDEFKFKDLKAIFTSKTFLIVAGLCVLYYSAIFPFQKFAADMLSSRLEISSTDASKLFSFFPIGAMILTPILGFFLDRVGKGATMLIIGAILMTICHSIFAFTPVSMFTFPVAIIAIIILGVSFSLVPAALWPSVPKLVDNKVLGSGYSVIFWIQNIGLMAVPALIGWNLDFTNPGVNNNLKVLRPQIDTMSQNIIALDSNKIVYDSLKVDFEDEFDTKIYSYKHKEAAFVANYTNELVTDLKQKSEELNLVFRNVEKRSVIISEMESLIAKYMALDTSIIYRSIDINKDTLVANDSNKTKTIKDTVALASMYFPKEVEKISEIRNRLSKISAIEGSTIYNYRMPMTIFAGFGILALILGLWLKVEDKKKGYGLEMPNVKKKSEDKPSEEKTE